MSKPTDYSVKDDIARIIINQPEQRNPLSHDVMLELSNHIDDIRQRENIRAVVIEGEGDAFSAGGDIGWMTEGIQSNIPPHQQAADVQTHSHRPIAELYKLTVPTIAKIDGPAVGAGAALAIACDLQIMSEGSVIGFVFRNVGLAVDSGTSYLLPRIVGTNIAKELIMTGEILDAERAMALGVVNRTVPNEKFESQASAFVDEVASGPTVALSASGRLIDEAFEKSFESALRDEATVQAVALSTDDHEEGVRAFEEGREPVFKGE